MRVPEISDNKFANQDSKFVSQDIKFANQKIEVVKSIKDRHEELIKEFCATTRALLSYLTGVSNRNEEFSENILNKSVSEEDGYISEDDEFSKDIQVNDVFLDIEDTPVNDRLLKSCNSTADRKWSIGSNRGVRSLNVVLNSLIAYVNNKLNEIDKLNENLDMSKKVLLDERNKIRRIKSRFLISIKAIAIKSNKEIFQRIVVMIGDLSKYIEILYGLAKDNVHKDVNKIKTSKFDKKFYDNLIGKLLNKSPVSSRELVSMKISYDECGCVGVKLGTAFEFNHEFMNNVFELFFAKVKSSNKHLILILTEDNLKEIFGKDIKLSNEEIKERIGEIFANLNIELLQLEHKNCLTFDSDGIDIFKISIGNTKDLRCFRKINKNKEVLNSLPTSELLSIPLSE
jgi:hypothetical protein